MDGIQSNFFPCCNGVRQGENWSPVLFTIFLNDIENYLLTQNDISLNITDPTLEIVLKLVIILYADDAVIFANREE